ncbi:hypothetical protein KM043_016502 [Ampulex compressa]|nr:hypothetical protein KM043_016502 [Ampulex compressa]
MNMSTNRVKLSVSDAGHRQGGRGQVVEPDRPAFPSSSSHDGRTEVQIPGSSRDKLIRKRVGEGRGDPSATFSEAIGSRSAASIDTGPTKRSDGPYTRNLSALMLSVVVIRTIDIVHTSWNVVKYSPLVLYGGGWSSLDAREAPA